jgi:hypothetical protein
MGLVRRGVLQAWRRSVAGMRRDARRVGRNAEGFKTSARCVRNEKLPASWYKRRS